jgi:hypothetical protein
LTAATSPSLGDMVDGPHPNLGDLEHLAADLADHLGVGQVRPATSAADRRMDHRVIWYPSGQVRARRAGLLSLPSTSGAGRGPTFSTRLARLLRVG